jgi:hypothetical protein
MTDFSAAWTGSKRMQQNPRAYFARRGRIETIEDLLEHDLIGFDRSDGIVKAYAANGHSVTCEDFPVRCDDQML